MSEHIEKAWREMVENGEHPLFYRGATQSIDISFRSFFGDPPNVGDSAFIRGGNVFFRPHLVPVIGENKFGIEGDWLVEEVKDVGCHFELKISKRASSEIGSGVFVRGEHFSGREFNRAVDVSDFLKRYKSTQQ